MFGRVRAASTSVDSLERPPSKILKDDPLSIYEATLMKLKLGSRHDDLSSHSAEEMDKETDSNSTSVSEGSRHHSSSHLVGVVKTKVNCAIVNNNSVESLHLTVAPHEEAMALDTDCSSACISPTSSCCISIDSSKQQKKQNVSVLYLFSKFRSSQTAPKLPNDEAVVNSSANSLQSSTDCQSFSSSNSPEAMMEEEHVCSLPVC